MTKRVANRSRSQRDTAAPITRNPKWSVGTIGDRSNPKVVIQPFWNVILLIELIEIAELAVHLLVSITTRMNGVDLPDCAGRDPLAHLSNGTAGVSLVAQLSDDFV